MTLTELLAKYPRLVITGAPRTGKTSLTLQVTDRPVIHTDDWLTLPWRNVPEPVKVEAEKHASFVVEGVRAPDVLRHGLEVDAVLYLKTPKVEQTPEQINMGKGIDTVLAQWAELNPNIPIIQEDELTSLTQDRADIPRKTRRYALSTLDYANGNVEVTPQGGRRIRATVTKAGVFDYLREGRTLREYRPAEELKKPEAMATLKGSPIVVLHPRENGGAVDTGNFKRLTVGHFEDPEWDEEKQAVVGWVVVNEAEAVAKVDAGELVEISCGYDNQRRLESGAAPDGKPYDLIQTDYVYNHIALGPSGWGRQGEAVGLTLDSNDNQHAAEPRQQEQPMPEDENKPAPAAPAAPAADKPETKDEVATGAPAAAPVTFSPEEIKALKDLLPLLTKLVNTGSAEAAAPAAPTADADKPAEEKKEPTLDAKDVERIAQEGVEVRTEAIAVMGEKYVTRGKSTREVKTDVIRTFDSAFSHEGKSDEAVSAAYQVALKAAADRAKHAKELAATRGALRTADSNAGEYKTLGDRIQDFQRSAS